MMGREHVRCPVPASADGRGFRSESAAIRGGNGLVEAVRKPDAARGAKYEQKLGIDNGVGATIMQLIHTASISTARTGKECAPNHHPTENRADHVWGIAGSFVWMAHFRRLACNDARLADTLAGVCHRPRLPNNAEMRRLHIETPVNLLPRRPSQHSMDI